MGFVADLATGILGEEDQRAENPFDVLSNTVQNPDQLFDSSLSMASLFTGAGDGLDVVGAATGRDPLSGTDLGGGERWLALLGVGAIGLAVVGGAAMSGMGASPALLLNSGRRQTTRWNVDLPTEHPTGPGVLASTSNRPGGEPVPQPGTVTADVDAEPSQFPLGLSDEPGAAEGRVTFSGDPDGPLSSVSQHHGSLDDPNRVFESTGQFTNNVLKVDTTVDPVTGRDGFRKLARDVIRDVHGGVDETMAGQTEMFLRMLGARLLDEVPAFRKMAARLADGSMESDADPALLVAAWVVARWDYAGNLNGMSQSPFRLEGKQAKQLLRNWAAIRDGNLHYLSIDGQAQLAQAMVDFQTATSWMTHPELVINPVVALSHINLDTPGLPQMGLMVLEFDHIPIEKMSTIEKANRIKNMIQLHPSGLVGLITDNIRMLFDRALEGDQAALEELRNTTLGSSLEGKGLLGLDKGASRVRGTAAESVIRTNRTWYSDARDEIEKVSQALYKLPGGKGRLSAHLDGDEKGIRYVAAVAAILSDGEVWESNIAKADEVLRVMRANPDATLEELHKILTTPGTITPRHGFINKSTNNPSALYFATELNSENAIDVVREVMGVDQDIDHVIDILAALNNGTPDDVLNAFGNYANIKRFGTPEEQAVFKKNAVDLIRQEIYYRTQKTLVDDGYGEVVTVYRGSGGQSALPDDTTRNLYPTSFQQSISEHHAHANASMHGEDINDPSLYQFEVAREDILTSMDSNIAYSRPGTENKSWTYEEEVQLAGSDLAKRANIRKRVFAEPPHPQAAQGGAPQGYTRRGTWDPIALNYDNITISQGDAVHMRQLVLIKLMDGVDDPLEVFDSGRAGGLRIKDLQAQIGAGVDLRHLAKERAMSAPWASQKQGLFAHSIVHSTDHDRDMQIQYLAQMMAGEGGWDGLKGERVPHENVRKDLPVVADRQFHKAGVGLSVNPPHAYAEHRFGTDQFAHAAAVVAGEIGEVDGVQVLPIEVQAIVWDQLRRMTGVTGPDGKPWPKGTDRTVAMGQSAGYRRPREGSGAGWTEGHGPDVQFSSSFLEWMTGAATSGLPLMRVADEGTDLTRYEGDLAKISYPEEGRPASSAAGPGRKIRFEIAQDGTAKLLTDGVSPRRNRYPSLIKHNGSNVLLNREPQQVGDVDAEFDRVAETTRSFKDPNEAAVLNARVHGATDELPGLMEGPMMQITARTAADGGGVPDHVAGHRAISTLLKENGIEHEVIDLNPHADKTVVYRDDTRPELGAVGDAAKAKQVFGPDFEQFRTTNDETRQARVFVFKTSDDMQRAAELLHARDQNVPGEPMGRGATRESAQSEVDASLAEDAKYAHDDRSIEALAAAQRLDDANYNFYLLDQIERAATTELQKPVRDARRKVKKLQKVHEDQEAALVAAIDEAFAKTKTVLPVAETKAAKAALVKNRELHRKYVDGQGAKREAEIEKAKQELDDLEANIDDDVSPATTVEAIRHDLTVVLDKQKKIRDDIDTRLDLAEKERAKWNLEQIRLKAQVMSAQAAINKYSPNNKMLELRYRQVAALHKDAEHFHSEAGLAHNRILAESYKAESDARVELRSVDVRIQKELVTHFREVADTFQHDKHKEALKIPVEEASQKMIDAVDEQAQIRDDIQKEYVAVHDQLRVLGEESTDLLDKAADKFDLSLGKADDASKKIRAEGEKMLRQKDAIDKKRNALRTKYGNDDAVRMTRKRAAQLKVDAALFDLNREKDKLVLAQAAYQRKSGYDSLPNYDPYVQKIETEYLEMAGHHADDVAWLEKQDIKDTTRIAKIQAEVDDLIQKKGPHHPDTRSEVTYLRSAKHDTAKRRDSTTESLIKTGDTVGRLEEDLYQAKINVERRGPGIAPGGETFDRNIDSRYSDDTPEIVYYADEDGAAPKGTVGVWEHHSTDASGRKLVVMSRSGGPNTPNAVKVFVEPGARNLGGELRGRISGRLEPSGRGDHLLTGGEDGTPMQFDGRVNVEPAGGQKIVSKGKDVGRGPFDVEVDGERPTQLVLYIPPPGQPGLPIMAYNDEGLELLQGMYGRERVVTVTESTVRVKTPDSKGKVGRAAYVYDQAQRGVAGERRGDMMLAQQVETLLASISTVPANGRRILPEANRTPKRRSTGPKPAKKKGV